MTYGESVRAMTDKELANFMAEVQVQICVRLLRRFDMRPKKDMNLAKKQIAAEWLKTLRAEGDFRG